MQGALAEKLRILRARKGVTISKASKAARVERHTLRDLELGERTPTYPTLYKLASYYDVPVEELMIEEGKARPKEDAPSSPQQPAAEEPVVVKAGAKISARAAVTVQAEVIEASIRKAISRVGAGEDPEVVAREEAERAKELLSY